MHEASFFEALQLLTVRSGLLLLQRPEVESTACFMRVLVDIQAFIQSTSSSSRSLFLQIPVPLACPLNTGGMTPPEKGLWPLEVGVATTRLLMLHASDGAYVDWPG